MATRALNQNTDAAPFPNRLHRMRVEEGLGLTDLARLARLSERTIREVERGERRAREVTLHQIVNAMNANPNRVRRHEYAFEEIFPPNQPELF